MRSKGRRGIGLEGADDGCETSRKLLGGDRRKETPCRRTKEDENRPGVREIKATPGRASPARASLERSLMRAGRGGDVRKVRGCGAAEDRKGSSALWSGGREGRVAEMMAPYEGYQGKRLD